MNTAARRAAVVLAVAFGLALMHAGVGQVMACDARTSMTSTAASMGSMDSMPPMTVGHPTEPRHAEPGHPGQPPVAAHGGQMCLSTPAGASVKASTSAPAVASLTVPAASWRPRHHAGLTRATGREPPHPDLVRVLCVNRR